MDWQRGVNDWNVLNATSSNLQDCRWIITAATVESALTIKFWTVDLEKGREFLWVYDGDSWNAPLLAQITANDEWSNNSLQLREVPMIRSTTGKLFLHYTADRISHRTGFYATWSTVLRCSEYCKHGSCHGEQCVCDEGYYGGDCSSQFCTGSVYLTGRTGSITDHAKLSNYQGYADCRWYINPTVPINFLTFRFTHFTLEGGMDFVYIHDGINESYPLVMATYVFNRTIDTAMTGDGLHRVVPLVGDVEPFVYRQHHMMLSSSPYALLHFKTDVNDNNITQKYPGLLDTSTYGPEQRIGFRVEYEGVFCAGISHVYKDTGSLEDGSGPHEYHGGQRCIWVLHPSPCEIEGRPNALPLDHAQCEALGPNTTFHRVLEMSFDVNIHPSDTLRVLDGNHTAAPLLQSFHNVTGKRIIVTSVSPTVLLEFVTDQKHHGQGFQVSWKSIRNKDIDLPGTLAPDYTKQVYDGRPVGRPPGLEASTLCAGVVWLTRLTDSFTDHVGPSTSYRNNMYCQWNIELPSYTQQIEWWVERLDLHPGKRFEGLNISGPAQLNVIPIGVANHTDADYVTLYKGRHIFEPFEKATTPLDNAAALAAATEAKLDPPTVPMKAFEQNDTRAVANWTGHFQYVNRTPGAVPLVSVPMLTMNSSRAYVIFRTSAQYVDFGFKMRYQAVFSDPQLCEAWGRGWGPKAEAEVNKAVQITLRTARFRFPQMDNWANRSNTRDKWYMTQGGAQFEVQVYHGFNGTNYKVQGSFRDLNTGYYMLSYTPQRTGKWQVDIKMHGPRGLEHITGSPFSVNVRTGPTEPLGCRILQMSGVMSDQGLDQVQPDKLVMFRVQAGDAFANPKDHGGDNVVVKLDGPQPVGGVVKDIGDGTYNASFSVSKAGVYTVFVGISYNEKYETAVYGSPFTIQVPKLPCPGAGTDTPAEECSGHGHCEDNGKCTCVPAYDGDQCEDELNKSYRTAIIVENVVIGCLLVLYGLYILYTSQVKSTDRGDAMLGELDDDEDEEVQFRGLKCCMHW